MAAGQRRPIIPSRSKLLGLMLGASMTLVAAPETLTTIPTAATPMTPEHTETINALAVVKKGKFILYSSRGNSLIDRLQPPTSRVPQRRRIWK